MADKVFPIIVAEFERNPREVLRVSLDQYRGRNTIDIRVWFRDGSQLKPGRKGLTMAVANLPALTEGLQIAVARAKVDGLLDG